MAIIKVDDKIGKNQQTRQMVTGRSMNVVVVVVVVASPLAIHRPEVGTGGRRARDGRQPVDGVTAGR